MAEKKTIELDIQSNLGSLKSQLREAQAEVAALADKFGATSNEAINAAKRAAELKDKIGDAKDLTDAFNPDAKMGAFTKSLGGVLDGLQGVQGAMGLFGVETEGVEKAMLKVQSAMALSQGYKGVMESIDSFKTLITQVRAFTVVQKISTALQWAWNAALEANPVVAIVTAIVALLVAGYKLISWLIETSEANETAAASIDKHNASLKKQNRDLENNQKNLEGANKFQYEYAKASGASAEQLRKLALKHAQEELALAKKNKELSRATYLREADILATLRANDASEEVIKKQMDLVKSSKESATKFNEIFVKENQDLLDLKRQQILEVKQEEADAKKQREQDEADRKKEQADKLKDQQENYKQQVADKKAALGELKKLEEDYRISQLSDYDKEKEAIQKKYKEQYDNAKKFKLDVTKLKENEAAELKALDDKQFDWNRGGEIEKIALKRKTLDKTKELQEQEKAGLVGVQEVKDRIAQREKDLEEDAKKRRENQIQGVKDSLQMLSDITTLFAGKSKKQQEKAFKVQKAINIANAVVDTYAAANKALASAPPPFNYIAMAAAITAGLVNVKKISQTQFNGGETSTGGGSNTTSGATGGGAITPSFNVVGNSGINQLAQLQQQPMKAYVVSGDVTTAQALDRNRIENATLVH